MGSIVVTGRRRVCDSESGKQQERGKKSCELHFDWKTGFFGGSSSGGGTLYFIFEFSIESTPKVENFC